MINGVCVNVRAVKTDREHQSKEGETNTTGVLKFLLLLYCFSGQKPLIYYQDFHCETFAGTLKMF